VAVSEALGLEEIHPLIERLVKQSSLFEGIDRSALAVLLERQGRWRHLRFGEDLISEGEAADAIYFVDSGHFEVRKRNEQGSESHRIGSVSPGAIVGEVALLDSGKRSATIRALEEARVLAISVDGEEVEPPMSPATRMRLNLAREMARRVRGTTENAVRHLEESLREAETRAEMGRFMSRVLIGTCLYMFALALMLQVESLVTDTTVISVAVLIAFAAALYVNIRTSMFPASAYGFTLHNWRPAMVEGLLFSLPVMALIVLGKWLLIQTTDGFEEMRLFDLYRYRGLDPATTLTVAGAYALFVPVQEMVARSGIQSSLMMFLRSRRKVALSIFMSTLLFSSTHLHTGYAFALSSFPVGLFWGWLYARRPTLVGVIFSHLLIGIWAVFVVSFPIF